MKFNLAELENKFLIENREIVKLETVISKLQEKSNLPLDFILDELDKIKIELEEKHHKINFILIESNKEPKNIFNKKFFDDIYSIISGRFVIYPYHEKYKSDVKIKTDLYLLKSDIEILIDEIEIDDNEKFFIPNFEGIDSNYTKYYQKQEEATDFLTSKDFILSFELWKQDKENYTANLTGLQQANARIAELLAENERLKAQIEQSQTDTKDYMLGSFIHPDPLAIALNVRLNEWGNYNHETGEGKKSATQIKNKIKKQYGINDTLAEQIERVACPIVRSRNK